LLLGRIVVYTRRFLARCFAVEQLIFGQSPKGGYHWGYREKETAFLKRPQLFHSTKVGPLAQLAEQLTLNQ
jgi:hypothetical protein